MKLTTLTTTVAAIFVLTQSAQAHGHHRHYTAYHRHYVAHDAARRHMMRERFFAEQDRPRSWRFATAGSWQSSSWPAAGWGSPSYAASGSDRGSLGGRPAAWCGWEMRQLVGGDPGPQYNLARNWAHWGHAGAAGVGAVVVWAHHVGKIVGEADGQWLIKSGNDGHAVRTRTRSIAGAIAIRWG